MAKLMITIIIIINIWLIFYNLQSTLSILFHMVLKKKFNMIFKKKSKVDINDITNFTNEETDVA